MNKDIRYNLPKLKDGQVFLAIDPSSSHLAYVLAEASKGGELHIHHASMIWTKDSWSRGKKLIYVQYSLNYLINRILPLPNLVFSESFFSNPKLLSSSSSVIPTVNHLIEMNCTWPETVPFNLIPPPTWRRILGIKANVTAKGKDWKQPARKTVEAHISLPEAVQSNITGKQRDVPHDLTDALAMALAVGKESGYTKVTVGNTWSHNFSFLAYLGKFEERFKFKGNRK